MPAERIIDVQRDVITKDLQYNKLATINAFNEPNLFIAPWCTNMINSFKNHRLEEDSEKEAEKYKDFSDALRILYATIDGIKYRPAVEKKEAVEYEYSGGQREGNWMV